MAYLIYLDNWWEWMENIPVLINWGQRANDFECHAELV